MLTYDKEKAKDLIKKTTPFKSIAYKVGDQWFIGYHHKITKKEKDGKVSRKGASLFLQEDLINVEMILKSLCYDLGIDLNPNQAAALIVFGFKCGVENLEKLLNDGAIENITDRMLKYIYAGGKAMKELEKNRNDEVELFKAPVVDTEIVETVAPEVKEEEQERVEVVEEKVEEEAQVSAVNGMIVGSPRVNVRSTPSTKLQNNIVYVLNEGDKIEVVPARSVIVDEDEWYPTIDGNFVMGKFVTFFSMNN